MRFPAIQSLYNDLTKDSLENVVDALWNNILPLYFRIQDNYAIEAQAGPDKRTKKKADFAVRYVHNGHPRKVVLIEDKRVCDEGSDAVWLAAMEQLSMYMCHARSTDERLRETLYGIITVGHYSRYYKLPRFERDLSNFSSNYLDYNGEALHFKKDEGSMHTLLMELVELTRK
ncbi:hypothetical protein F4779DRAFT_305634 [Xylariaceae sp. FL0662B]|nr:hypothetical protein F4779DRAFT_305634 [Xylariaceae sp. FL0662B]